MLMFAASALDAEPASRPAIGTSGTWSEHCQLLHPRSAHALVSTPTSLYALAGTSVSGTPVLPVERFNAATSSWSLETTLPGEGLNATAAVVLGDRILLIGGFNATTNVPTPQLLAYDLSTHGWAEGNSERTLALLRFLGTCAQLPRFCNTPPCPAAPIAPLRLSPVPSAC